ncbi:hypothetical protein N7495_008496 [Penicillium taxi]|uniref:uncharacterized protein n=1 Tax=Penicillium taxi TaxID=168475 RepID=UPI00254562A5|nr:uncharacterized protein N7495_008496 [Penicillium taxi]KAJ5888455.1 hypothetical protein N7495_008496 [Penicillium taxi]
MLCPRVSRLKSRTTRLLASRQKRSIAQLRSTTLTSELQSRQKNIIQTSNPQRNVVHRFSTATEASDEPARTPTEAINTLIERINKNDDDMAVLMEELELLDDPDIVNDSAVEDATQFEDLLNARDNYTSEEWVKMVRQGFGDTIPEGTLDDADLRLYTSLYGEPVIRDIEDFVLEGMEAEEDEDSQRLFREDGQGDIPVVYDMEGNTEEETIAMRRTREVAEQLGGEIMLEQFENEAFPDSAPRSHPITMEGKFQTNPSTVNLPKDTFTGPISVILSEYSNKHIAETAHRLFGGPGLPHSTTTPPPRAQLPQLPIPLHASQRHMGDMEANAYIAALYPGMYASTLSVLAEVRKRLGTDWLRRLIYQEKGPNVLDASAGGAGILAWRDVVNAEYQVMVPDHPEGAPVPYGRSTVVTGSHTLQLRAAAILENTTFLPRLPDYVHVRDKATLDDERAIQRKQYDVIIAPHSLLGLTEDYERKEHVEKLWELLNPDGGVLILLEKGRQKGFEAIAGAREMLLRRHIASPGSTEYESSLDSPDESLTVQKETGMIIAPCTTHSTCPMHNSAGPMKGRKDYCHFEQRYIRPPFLQRIMNAKDRNHEDIKYSYIAVQRGVDLRQQQGIRQDTERTDAAFEGFEHLEDAQPSAEFNPLSLPRAVYAPMKRRGHVIFDLCTPAGKIERWTVPRSFSKQAYRDARKSNWGDLWALGAKTRIPRKLNLGSSEGKKERLARRAADKAAREEEDEFDDEYDEEDAGLDDGVEAPVRKQGQRIPSWKKHNDKKKQRQAQKKQDTC